MGFIQADFMKVWFIDDDFSLKRPVATIGIFDGVHTGHRFILDHLKTQTESHGGRDGCAYTLATSAHHSE